MDACKESIPAIRRLLHINNPAAILRLVEKFCQTQKFSVDSIDSASVGLHHALTRKYHIIILGLPARGLDPNRFLKGLLRAKITTPVLIMAESQSKERHQLAKYTNILGFISKPLDIHEFSKFLTRANRPPDLELQEKEKLNAVLRKWEAISLHEN